MRTKIIRIKHAERIPRPPVAEDLAHVRRVEPRLAVDRDDPDVPPGVDEHLADGQDAEKILTAARKHRERAGTLNGMAAGETVATQVRDPLADALDAFRNEETELSWGRLAARLAELQPERYAETSPEALSATLHNLRLGIQSVNVRDPEYAESGIAKGGAVPLAGSVPALPPPEAGKTLPPPEAGKTLAMPISGVAPFRLPGPGLMSCRGAPWFIARTLARQALPATSKRTESGLRRPPQASAIRTALAMMIRGASPMTEGTLPASGKP